MAVRSSFTLSSILLHSFRPSEKRRSTAFNSDNNILRLQIPQNTWWEALFAKPVTYKIPHIVTLKSVPLKILSTYLFSRMLFALSTATSISLIIRVLSFLSWVGIPLARVLNTQNKSFTNQLYDIYSSKEFFNHHEIKIDKWQFYYKFISALFFKIKTCLCNL